MNAIIQDSRFKVNQYPSIFTILLVLCLFYSDRLLGGVALGPFPIRIYVILIVFFITLLLTYKSGFRVPSTLKGLLGLYLVYIIWHFIVTFINGDYLYLDLPKYFLSRYLTILMLAYILIQLIKKRSTLRWILIGVWSFLLLNVLTVILQQFQFDPAWHLADFVSPNITYIGEGKYYFKTPQEYPPTVPVGLMGFVVTTGYMIAGFFPLIFVKYFKGQYYRFLLMAVVGFSAALFCQQRSALLVTLLFFWATLYFLSKKKSILTLVGLVTVSLIVIFFEPILVFMLENVLNNADKFQKNVLEDYARTYTYLHAFNFIGEFPLFGGRGNYYAMYPYYVPKTIRFTPHNVILNGYVDAGLIGICLIATLFVASIRRLYQYFKEYLTNGNYLPFLLFSSAICFMFNSLFHSDGFTSGDNFFWWFAILAAIDLDLSHKNKMNVSIN